MEQDKYLISGKTGFPTRRFKIVSVIGSGHFVWNIGREHFPFEGYIPLAEADGADCHHINPDTLLAYNVGSEELALKIIDRASHERVGMMEISAMSYKDPFNFFPNENHEVPDYRVEYRYSGGVETSSPAIFGSDKEVIEAALANKSDACAVQVLKYIGKPNGCFETIPIYQLNWR